jgi:hypothetical protein
LVFKLPAINVSLEKFRAGRQSQACRGYLWSPALGSAINTECLCVISRAVKDRPYNPRWDPKPHRKPVGATCGRPPTCPGDIVASTAGETVQEVW